MSQTKQRDFQRQASESGQTLVEAIDKARESWPRRWDRWVDGLWGYDVFISYRRSDAAVYARALHEALEAENTNSFIDATQFVPGDPLPQATLRNVRKSTLLVVLITPQICELRSPDWVLTEVDAYLASHPEDPRVIAVFFADDLLVQAHPVVKKLRSFLHIKLAPSAINAAPSKEVTDAIRSQLGSRRRDRRRIRLFQYIAVGVSLLALLAVIATGGFWTQRTAADQNAREAASRLLAFESNFERPNFPQRSLLLAAASVNTTRDADHKVLPESFVALLDSLQVVSGKPIAPELGRLSFLDSGNSGLVLGKKQTGELFILDPFEEASQVRTIAVPAAAKLIWAAIAEDKLLALDEKSSIFSCLIAHAAASDCKKILTVEGASSFSVAPAAARILLTTPAGPEVWDMERRKRLYVRGVGDQTAGTGYTISPKGRFIARTTFMKQDGKHDSGALELTNVETGQITRFDWRGDALYTELRSSWFATDEAALVVEAIRWRANPSNPADLTGTPAMIGVRLGQTPPHDFDIAGTLGWDSPQWRPTIFGGDSILRTTKQGVIEVYRTEGPNGLVRAGTFRPVSVDSTFFPAKNGCAVAEATTANAIYIHFGTCEGRPYSKVQLPAIQGALEGRRIFVSDTTRLIALLPSQNGKSFDVWHAPTDRDNEVKHWSLSGNEATTVNVLFSKSGLALVAISLRGELRRWDLQADDGGVPTTIFTHPNYVVNQLASTKTPGLLAHVSSRGGVVFSDLRGKAPVHHRLLQQVGIGMALRFLQDDKYLLYADVNGVVALWEVASVLSGASDLAVRSVLKGPLTGLEISGDGNFIAIASEQSSVLRIYRLTQNPIALMPVCELADQVGQVTAGVDGSTFFASIRDGQETKLVQVDPRQAGCSPLVVEQKSPASFDVQTVSTKNGLLAYPLRKSGKLVVVVRHVDPATGRSGAQIQELVGPETQVTALAFSPDGRWLAAGGSKGTAFLWEFRNGVFKLALQSDAHAANSPGMNSDVSRFAFDPSGKWLVSSSVLRNNVVLWDLSQTPPTTVRLAAFNSDIGTMSFAQSGQLVAGRVDGRVEIWPLATEVLLKRACAVAGRELGSAELTALIGNVKVASPCSSAPLQVE
ncbi:hypothetical protein BRAO375_4180011 [Bradyrhizobium sp. ORS 375]|uniref:toll/interleukin-1 receptor domain-containing protein n=1 Tax=Bradyrhizobium sp. (strain ORS 375) TaxID=566679 RepID=UPI0002406F7E|nr:toll/interleukin-1 receptor domain-containing protein [Bradyrhizobium sp. ORS 375]CCD95356.1 hypothetical protein BRAO375_4180011 [Bradyrhizobium sp. ORS 375]